MTEAVIIAGFEAIAKIVQLIEDSKSGKLDPNAALSQIQSIHDQLAANNSTADAELKAKFPEAQPKG